MPDSLVQDRPFQLFHGLDIRQVHHYAPEIVPPFGNQIRIIRIDGITVIRVGQRYLTDIAYDLDIYAQFLAHLLDSHLITLNILLGVPCSRPAPQIWRTLALDNLHHITGRRWFGDSIMTAFILTLNHQVILVHFLILDLSVSHSAESAIGPQLPD